MPYYKKCDLCGANLDPGERCTCVEDAKREAQEQQIKRAVNVTMQLLCGRKRKIKKRR